MFIIGLYVSPLIIYSYIVYPQPGKGNVGTGGGGVSMESHLSTQFFKKMSYYLSSIVASIIFLVIGVLVMYNLLIKG